jgi:hypothetical protein
LYQVFWPDPQAASTSSTDRVASIRFVIVIPFTAQLSVPEAGGFEKPQPHGLDLCRNPP